MHSSIKPSYKMSAKYTAYDCLASAAARSFLLATGHKDHAEAILNLRYYARELESDNREQRELLKVAKLNFARIAGVAENSQSAQLARLLKIKTLAEEAIAEFEDAMNEIIQANMDLDNAR